MGGGRGGVKEVEGLGMRDWVRLFLHQEQGGVGFFLACEEFWRMFDNLFPACAFKFFFFLMMFLNVKISSRTLVLLFRPGSVHSGSAS